MDNRSTRSDFSGKLVPLSGFETSGNDRAGVEYHIDTSLRLESPGSSGLYSSILTGRSGLYSSNLTGTKRKWGDVGRADTLSCTSLGLGLGCSPSSSDSSWRSSAMMCTVSLAKTDVNCQLHLGSESTPISKDHTATTSKTGCALDLQLTLSLAASESVITSDALVPVQACQQQTVDEGSTSSSSRFGSHVLPYLYNPEAASEFSPNQQIPAKVNPVPSADLSSMLRTPTSSIACSSGVIQPFNTNTKKCMFQGCGKGARGASGLCIAHGGGRRCQKDGCQKGAEGRTIYCKAHGGGRRCEHLGCTKSAEGRTDYCIAHGGGHRCLNEGCTRAARGKSGLCIKHGGGKRCKKENCTKSAEGHSGLCISHGGGRRCQHPECSKGAQGGTMFCKAHGGGKRCTFSGCNKGAEGSTPFCKGHGGGKRCSFQDGCGKSVHGGTDFCVAHGGGKRCAAPECTRSARGRTEFCVRHGGGKRCKFDGCGKSAQGSTDYCKAHGGGNRCSWGQLGSDFGAGDLPCDRLSRGKNGFCSNHGALVQDQCVHGGALVDHVADRPITNNTEKMKGIACEEFMLLNLGERLGLNTNDQKKLMHQAMPLQTRLVSLPEGRVHGGSFLAMLTSSGGLGSYSAEFFVHLKAKVSDYIRRKFVDVTNWPGEFNLILSPVQRWLIAASLLCSWNPSKSRRTNSQVATYVVEETCLENHLQNSVCHLKAIVIHITLRTVILDLVRDCGYLVRDSGYLCFR